jgi:hypothetical protein
VADLVKVVNEGVSISENASAIISLTFELYYPLYIGGAITNSAEITFTPDASDPKYITGFAIKVLDPNEKKVKSAIKRGKRTVNYLSAMTGVAVRSKRPKIEKQTGDTPQTRDTPKERDFDLDASKLTSLLSEEPPLNKKAASYQSGMAALEDHDLVGAVQRFYQVIEESGLTEAEKYKPLRVACSHHKVDDKML